MKNDLSIKTATTFKNLLDSFDFERVHDCMKKFAIIWCASNNNVPSIQQMKEHVKNLYISSIEYCFANSLSTSTISSGCFEFSIERNINEKGEVDITMALRFIFEDSDSCISDLDD